LREYANSAASGFQKISMEAADNTAKIIFPRTTWDNNELRVFSMVTVLPCWVKGMSQSL
jgi:hypothetical protein